MSAFVFLTLLLGYLIYTALFPKKARFLKTLKNEPMQFMQDLPPKGRCHTQGKILALHPLRRSPLFKKDSIGYKYEVRKKKRKKYVSIVEDNVLDDFVIEHQGCFAFIPAAELNLLINIDTKISSTTFDAPSKAELQILSDVNRSSSNFLGFNHPYSYREGALEIEKTISIFGHYDTKLTADYPELKDIVTADTIKVFYAKKDESIYLTDLCVQSIMRVGNAKPNITGDLATLKSNE